MSRLQLREARLHDEAQRSETLSWLRASACVCLRVRRGQGASKVERRMKS